MSTVYQSLINLAQTSTELLMLKQKVLLQSLVSTFLIIYSHILQQLKNNI